MIVIEGFIACGIGLASFGRAFIWTMGILKEAWVLHIRSSCDLQVSALIDSQGAHRLGI